MAKYEILKTEKLSPSQACLQTKHDFQLVYLNDSAFAVMVDFAQQSPRTIGPDELVDNALDEMKVNGVHLLLVKGKNENIIGVIGSEDILGELPIKIIQQKRIKRSQVLVKMIMTPIDKIAAFNIDMLEHAKVGNIVVTLKSFRTHYALVMSSEKDNQQLLRGIFTTSQISRQLHRHIADSIAKAQSVSELQKRGF